MMDPELMLVEVPVGAVLPYAGPINTCSQTHLRRRGWLLCDGSPVSRAEYPELFAVLRRLYGYPEAKSGSAPAPIFCLPDYRGLFLRGLNRNADPPVDPEADKRTYANPTNQNGNQGNQVGSLQGEAIQEHEHEYVQSYLSTSPPKPLVSPTSVGMIYPAAPPPPTDPPTTPPTLTLMSGVTNTSETVVSSSSDSQPDIVETRPVNAAVNFIIKCRSTVPPYGPIGDWCGNDTKDSWPPPPAQGTSGGQGA